jgi:transposase
MGGRFRPESPAGYGRNTHPAKIQVNTHIRLKYGPCKCDGFLHKETPEIKTAPMPPRMIPQSIVSPGLLAYVITSKFVDSLPFYRQSKMFERIDLEISRATLCNWAILAAEKCSGLLDLMTKDIRGGPVIRMDETTLQVLKEPGRPAESKSYMWVIAGYQDERPIVLYNYHTGRSAKIPFAFLEDYKGYLQTDGYKGYNKAGSLPGIVHVGCVAHARRYFHEASRLSKKSKAAYRGLDFIRKLYEIENELHKPD